MRNSVNIFSCPLPKPNINEILRYSAGGKDQKTLSLLNDCLAESENLLSPKVCYRIADLEIKGDICFFEDFSVCSKNLAKNLENCKKAVIFCATIGAAFDRLLIKYSRISPAKALLFQGIGAERIEALCDTFCHDLEKQGFALRPRFSPGYGDLPLTVTKDIFSLLSPEEAVGVTLNDGMLMTPTKSVTAFIGLLGE